jgi:replicative DNA helicase
MSHEAEVAFIGCILTDPGCADDALALVVPDELTDPRLRAIFAAVASTTSDGLTADVISVATTLRRQDRLEEAGGMGFLSALIDAVPTSAGLTGYAKRITEAAQLRRLRDAARNILSSSEHPGDVPTQQILEHAAAAVLDLIATTSEQGPRHISAFTSEALDDLRRKGRGGGVTGIRTGYPLLDYRTGGLQPGCVYVIAGRPSQGKSALAGNIGIGAAMDQRVPTLFVSLEMAGYQLVQRAWSARSGIELHAGINNQHSDAEVVQVAAELDAAPFWLDDCSQGLSLSRLRARVRTLEKTQGLGLVIVDYLQLMSGTKRDRRQEVEEVSRGIKMLARASNLPVILLSQLSRFEKGVVRKPTLSDLRESGAIEQDADAVALIHVPLKDPQGQEVWPVSLELAKMRGGPTGPIPLRFDRTISRFFPSDDDEYRRLSQAVTQEAA